MKCKICGYKIKKSSEKISICPNCGEKISSKNKKNKPLYDPATISKYFKDIGCSLEQKQDEFKISRFVNGGDFYVLGGNLLILLFILLGFICIILNAIFGEGFVIATAILFAVILSFTPQSSTKSLAHLTFIVNSKGILITTINRKFFIPKDKIDNCFSKKVKRIYRNSEESESFYDVIIKLNYTPESSNIPNNLFELLNNPNKLLKVRITSSEIDTGLCYKSKKPTYYLADEFNKYLGIEVYQL